MKRVAVAGFQHETNTFSPVPTRLEDFERPGSWPGLTRGEDLREVFKGTNIPVAGFMDACRHTVVPLLWASAEPGGYVSGEAFDTISHEIVEGIARAAPDAIYLDLHGAMVTRRHEDAEAELLRRIRARAGYEIPIAVSLDMHGNMSRAFFELATVVAIYRTYPHTDMARTGARAASLLDRVMTRPLHKSFKQIDFVIPITAQSTHYDPSREIYASLNRSTAVSVDICMGFPPADVSCCGPSVFAYAETAEQAELAADQIEQRILISEQEFSSRLIGEAEAIRIATSATRFPTVIADPQDNPGAGATCDTTGLLRALVKADVPKTALSMLYDPEAAKAAHAAGKESELEMGIGGRFTKFSSPLEARFKVIDLSDGQFTFTGPMYGGTRANLGQMAHLRILGTDISVVVGSERAQNADKQMFRTVGIEPADCRILCVKSSVHFLADYSDIAETVLFAESPGANPSRLGSIEFTNLRPGMRLLD